MPRPLQIAKEWSLSGWMNILDGCGKEDCDPHCFPIDMSDGSQRTACLKHVPSSERRNAMLIILGRWPKPPLDEDLEKIDRNLEGLPDDVRNEALTEITRRLREGKLKA